MLRVLVLFCDILCYDSLTGAIAHASDDIAKGWQPNGRAKLPKPNPVQGR